MWWVITLAICKVVWCHMSWMWLPVVSHHTCYMPGGLVPYVVDVITSGESSHLLYARWFGAICLGCDSLWWVITLAIWQVVWCDLSWMWLPVVSHHTCYMAGGLVPYVVDVTACCESSHLLYVRWFGAISRGCYNLWWVITLAICQVVWCYMSWMWLPVMSHHTWYMPGGLVWSVMDVTPCSESSHLLYPRWFSAICHGCDHLWWVITLAIYQVVWCHMSWMWLPVVSHQTCYMPGGLVRSVMNVTPCGESSHWLYARWFGAICRGCDCLLWVITLAICQLVLTPYSESSGKWALVGCFPHVEHCCKNMLWKQ